MTTVVPELIGPIPTGASFMMVSIQNTHPYLLIGTPINDGILYYWESNINTIAASKNVGVFTAQGTLTSMTINDNINRGGIAFRADGVTLGNAALPATLMMSQQNFANFFPPNIFLSAVPYTIFNSSGHTASILTSTSPTGSTILANNIIILPVLWYFNCTAGGTYNFINQPAASVLNWFCLAATGTTGCSQVDIAPGGWTNLTDCTAGNMFPYCFVGQTCGAQGCNGPCSVSYDDCTFSNGTYTCVFNPNLFFGNSWWTSPYFIGAVIGLVLIIIIIIIITFAVARSA